MKHFLRPFLVIGALGAAAVGIALALGRSASTGLYVGGAILLAVAAVSRGTMITGAYGEYANLDSILRSNALRAAYLFFGLVMIGLGVLAETLAD